MVIIHLVYHMTIYIDNFRAINQLKFSYDRFMFRRYYITLIFNTEKFYWYLLLPRKYGKIHNLFYINNLSKIINLSYHIFK